MEPKIYTYEKIALGITNILSLAILVLTTLIYIKYTEYRDYTLIHLLIVIFITGLLFVYALLRILGKEEQMLMIGIITLFSITHNALLINLFVGLKNIHKIYGYSLFAITSAKTLLIILLFFHKKIEKKFEQRKYESVDTFFNIK